MSEIARVLTPGGTYFAQHLGGGTNVEISEYLLGPLSPGTADTRRSKPIGPGMQAWRSFSAETSVCGWRSFDVGAMVFFLRKAIWTVPDFTVDR